MSLAASNEKVSIMFNSKNRTSGTISNYIYNIDKDVKRITELSLGSVIIPYSFYAITATNNTLDTSSGTVTLPPGNYTGNSVVIEIQDQLQVFNIDYLVTYSTTTQKITISNASITFSVAITGTASTLLGFSTATAVANSHTADGVLNVSGPLYLVLKSSILSRALAFRNVYTDNSYDSSIASIPVNVNAGGFIVYQNSTTRTLGLKLNFTPTTDIDIQLQDEDGNDLEMNGIDWSIDLIATIE
jgi:hypothetical protein